MKMKIATSVVILSAIAAYFVDMAFHSAYAGIPIFAATLMLVIGYVVLAQQTKREAYSTLPWLLLIPFLIVWLFIRDSYWLTMFNVFNALGLFVLFVVNERRDKIEDLRYNIEIIPHFFDRVFQHALDPLQFLYRKVFKKKMSDQVALGLIISVPIIIIIAVLLISADLVVQYYLEEIFDDLWELISQVITHSFSLLYLAVFSGVFYAFVREHNAQDIEQKKSTSNSSVDTQTVFRMIGALVSVTLLLFLVVQLRYLFGDASVVENLGISYQEYARRGFFQLLAVAFIVFSIIWFLSAKYADATKEVRNKAKHFMLDYAIVYIMIAEVVLLLVSALKRVWLFVDTLQWGTKRFFAMEGMVLFIVILVFFLAHLLLGRFTRKQFLYLFVILFSVNTLVLNIINPDKFIANQNTNAYIEGGEEYELDFDETAYVSADAVDEGIQLYNEARTDKEKERAATALRNALWELDRYHEKSEEELFSYHAAKAHAYEVLDPLRSEIEATASDSYYYPYDSYNRY